MKNVKEMTHHFIPTKGSIAVIVEDDKITSDAIDFFVSEHVEIVKKFTNVNDAKKFIEKNHQDIKLILCDYYLEGDKNGSALAKHVKSLNSNLNYWIMTAQMDSLCEESDLDLMYVDHYLDKPLDFDTIRNLFENQEAA